VVAASVTINVLVPKLKLRVKPFSETQLTVSLISMTQLLAEPALNTISSPAVGNAPVDQLASVDQLSLAPAPVQVMVAAKEPADKMVTIPKTSTAFVQSNELSSRAAVFLLYFFIFLFCIDIYNIEL
jgi:hypothetical protein